ncbi:hypothetical protein C8F01DRAFT_32399 [Mycena amicta]|nr:hypothetical protein C8F01DRAFT_32399 [Mycena amicta]
MSTPESRAADRARIEAIESQIRRLSVEMALLQHRLASYRYPVLTLPNEMTSAIFLHYIPNYPHPPPLSGTGSPMTLIQVCQHWRHVALSLPALWRAIPLDEASRSSDVANWIDRSGSLPLSFQTVLDARFLNPPLTHLVFSCHSRWEHVRIYLDDLPGLPRSLETPQLRHIELQGSSLEDVPLFTDAPMLRSALLWDFRYPLGLLPWSQLTALALILNTPVQCAEILQQTPNLVYCELLAKFVEATDPQLARIDILLPHVETLALNRYSNVAFYMDLLPRQFFQTLNLITPALRRLQVVERLLWPDPVDALTSFINTSACKLEEICIIQSTSSTRELSNVHGVPLSFSEDEWENPEVSDRTRHILTGFAFENQQPRDAPPWRRLL